MVRSAGATYGKVINLKKYLEERMKRLWIVSASLLMLTGCAGNYQQTQNQIGRDTVTLKGPDYTIAAEFGSLGGSCVLAAVNLTNGAAVERPTGLWTVTILDHSKSTLGEILVTCPTTFPGGSGACTLVQRLVVPCQSVGFVSARGPGNT